MSTHITVVAVGIPALAGLIAVAAAAHYLRNYVAFSWSTPADVADVDGSAGTVELTGWARPVDDPLSSPFLGEDTLTYEWRLYQRKRIDSNDQWVDRGEERASFLLADGTGQILIDPGGATLALEEEVVLETGDETPPPEPAREKLGELGREVAADSPDEFLERKFYASRLDPGDEVHVYGPVQPGPAEDAPKGAVRPYVGTDSDGESGRFVVTDSREEETKQRHLTAALRWGVAGVGLLALAAVLFRVL